LAATCALCQLTGCFGPLVNSTQIVKRIRPTAPPVGSSVDTVALDVAVLEIPITDPAGLAAIWSSADEQVVPPESKARLDDNGLRIGVIGGIPPAAFLNSLLSDKTNPAPHQWIKKAGEGKLVPLGGMQPECRLDLSQDGATKPLTFENAQCGLQMTPILSGDAIALQFVPQVQYGKRSLWPGTDEGGGWAMQGQRPVERFTALEFQVSLGATEYLVVGRREKPNSLGMACFRCGGERPCERLLAVRASRLGSKAAEPLTQNERGVLPLAAQAAGTPARGAQWP
jgi:hypothetical protein